MTNRQRRAEPAARAAALGLLWLLAGCSYLPFGSEGNEALRDLDAVPAWFKEHRGELEVVMRLLMPHEPIHRVNSHAPMYNSQYGELSPADQAAYAGAWAMLDQLNVPVVIVHRDWERETPVFYFVLWRIGMVGSGESTKVAYDEAKHEAMAYWETWPHDEVVDLGGPAWYAHRSVQ